MTVCVVTENSATSKWVNWEVEESMRMGKGVVAMYTGDAMPTRLPDAVREHHVKVVPWQHAALMRAIDEAAETRGAEGVK